MSNAPFYVKPKEIDKTISKDNLEHSMLVDGLIDSYNHYHMGVTAENVAEKYQITRKDQDEFALNSQNKTIKAMDLLKKIKEF